MKDPSEADGEEMERLEEQLKDWTLYNGALSLELFNVWENSGRVVLPRAGGWLDQPQWVRSDFLTLAGVKRWHDLNKPKKKV